MFKKLLRSWAEKILEDKAPEPSLKTRDQFIEEHEISDKPWAMFEVNGFEKNGQIKVEFNWNQAFIDTLNELGFTAETQEDTVQLFFYTAQMKPTALTMDGGDETVQSADLPTMSPNANRMVR